MNFWETLKKPIMILAPMDGVTDTVFRQIVKSVGSPDVFVTEFVPVEAILSAGRERAMQALQFDKKEKPVVAQIWGTDPKKFYTVAKMLSKMGFDGIDINMGCPDKSTIKIGACSALIKNPSLAVEIINATIKGAGKLPVSVKTRIGFGTNDIESWVSTLLQTPIAALTLHLRTVKEMSKVPAHWEEISKAVKIRDRLNPRCLIIGNGDVKSLEESKVKSQKYKIDGVMIGRGIFQNVWLFNENINPETITPKDKIKLLLKHLNLFKKTFSDRKHFALMKKFVKCYVNNFPNSLEVREKMMETKTLDELIKITKLYDATSEGFGGELNRTVAG